MPHVRAVERRPQIVAAAIAVMSDRGVDGASTRAVAAAAGVPQATIHYLFGSREELLRAVLETVTEQVCTTIHSATAAGSDLETVLSGFVEVLARGVQEEPGQHLLLLELTLHALRRRGLRELARWQYTCYAQAAGAALDRICRQTGSRLVGDQAELVPFVLAVLDGLTVQELIDDDTKSARSGLRQLKTVLSGMFEPATHDRATTGDTA